MEEQLINLIQEPESQLSDSAFPLKEETYRIIGLAMEVHKFLGKGFLEVLYKDAMELELKHNQIPYQREKSFRI